MKRVLLAGAMVAGLGFGASGDLRLIDAVKDRDPSAVSSLLGGRIDVNSSQPDGATALAWAVYLDQSDTVDLLLKAGAKVNTADEYGETPLTLACGTGNAKVLEKLIKAGAEVNATRWNGETALMIASRSGSLEAVKLLLANGAKINAADTRKGQNALMWAAAEGHSDVVDTLIQQGADVKTASKAGFTALVFATQKGDASSVLHLLTAGDNPNYKVPSGMPVLQIAVSGGYSQIVAALLQKDADSNAADRAGNTALHLAAQAGNVEMIKMLLDKGANPNARTGKIALAAGRGAFRAQTGEQTPLLLAARTNHEAAMRALIAGGSDPTGKAQDGSTLLMAAANSGHVEVVKYAYELAPDIQAVTDHKSTVMHSAVTFTLQNSTQPEICKVVQFLADKGADLDGMDANGRTPIVVADILPIDKAVELITKLIVDSGKTPKIPSKR